VDRREIGGNHKYGKINPVHRAKCLTYFVKSKKGKRPCKCRKDEKKKGKKRLVTAPEFFLCVVYWQRKQVGMKMGVDWASESDR
jgi:hypothetical protein